MPDLVRDRLGHMTTKENIEEATEILQQIGLKEYEARCFVGLTRMSSGTAKQLSDVTDVPRTRVYDAIRVLEATGLVEVQHSSPQQFRAVSLTEATETLQDQHESRIEQLRDALQQIDEIKDDEDSSIQEVWALSGSTAIANRTYSLLDRSNSEVVFVLGTDRLLTDELISRLNGLPDTVDLLIGTLTEDLATRIEEVIPSATTFVSGLGWLKSNDEEETSIGRMLLVDRTAILVSSIVPHTLEERAIYGSGFGNGLVVIARRLLSEGLLPGQDPGQ